MQVNNRMITFSGAFTALVTPMRNGEIDTEAFENLLEKQIAAKIEGVVVCGCTGEAATLSVKERFQLIETAVRISRKRISVIAGTGTNSTQESIELTGQAKQIGADAAMLITPYYNKPTQEGLYRHFMSIADEVEIPMILYNVPSRTGVCLEPATLDRLYVSRSFAAVKEAGGRVDIVSDIISTCDITILSGDDALTLPMMALGAKGVVSVISNLVPDKIRTLAESLLEGNLGMAGQIHYELLPLVRAAFIETNPGPIKAMLNQRGLMENELRPPLAPLGKVSLQKLTGVVDEYYSHEGR